MGRLLIVHPCPVCNYHVEDELHEGGSGIAPLILRNHYALAICRNCRHLVSVLVPNTDEETQDALKTARQDIVQMEADAVIGDKRARDLLPLFREALDSFETTDNPTITITCTMCGSTDVEIQSAVNGQQMDAEDAWIMCPRCQEGRLLVVTTGSWD